ncbi:uncharacterized protein LY89DRAFT_782760 [Mollisia scopiformis]|uniref:Uncharacterized protein n=1 Tax=Mollisia scopiformis TaxID=149040 RepID=A0A194X8L4_MOLSC|nr:uncharacterized protein LY89DRAFT_782760 [Mollisia scopiformis]KUJ16511.1 hypothetical protein LY89DRAFT_782760 [Mollisia scopiformis]
MGWVSKADAIGKIKWSLYHGAPLPEQLPDGDWGINMQGDYYLNHFDECESYYYFNADGSWYHCDGTPGNPDALGAAKYVTPRGDTIQRPSTTDASRPNSGYFVGVDWKTGYERIYWDDGMGNFARTFRKDIQDVEKLDKFKVRTARGSDGKELVFDVADDGTYEGPDPKIILAMKFEKSREERRTSHLSHLSPRKIPLPASPPVSPEKRITGMVGKKLFPVSVKVEPVDDDPFMVR